MKRCPECRRDYYDDSLLYCLDDGTPLLEGPATADPNEPVTALLSGDPPRETPTAREVLTTAERAIDPETSAKEHTIHKAKRSRSNVVVIATLIIIAIIGTGFLIYKLTNHNGERRISFETAKITRLTTTGKAVAASISPDGKYVAYTVNEGARRSIWLRQVAAANSNVQIVPPVEAEIMGVTFSPDANYVYYTLEEKDATRLYQVPVLGGAPRQLQENVLGSISFSPDGKQFAFERMTVPAKPSLMIANADGSGARELFAGERPETSALTLPTWSPDGKMIAVQSSDHMNGASVMAVNLKDGTTTPISSHQWFTIQQMKWLGDSSGLVVVGRQNPYDLNQLWLISYPGGDIRRVTNDLADYRDVSVTADSRTLAAVQDEQLSSIWVLPNADASRAKPITPGVGSVRSVFWTPDGKIVYVSMATGSPRIWVTDADGHGQRQLTGDDYEASAPAVSPDGRHVAFISRRAGNLNVWQIDINGANLQQLTNGAFDNLPFYSPDGQWLVYTSSDPPVRRQHLVRIPLSGGDVVQLADKNSRGGIVSPDGRLIACWYWRLPTLPIAIAVIPFEGGEPLKLFDLPPSALPPVQQPPPNYLRWTADSRAILYIDTRDGVSNLWMQPVDGGAPKQLTDFKADRIFSFDWSSDGKQLALSRGTEASDVVLIKDFLVEK